MTTNYGDLATSGSLDLGASNAAANEGIATGKNAINSFDPTGTKTNQQTALGQGGLGGLLGGETSDYINKYTQAVKNNPTVQALYNTGNQMFGVQPLAQTANYLQNEVTNAIPSGVLAAKGFDIGSPQIQNGVATRLAYLQPQANAATNTAQTAQNLAGQFVQAGIAQNQQNLLPVQAEQQNLLQQQAAQATGWNNAAQSEFQGLIDKMNAGVTLSQAEIARANTLAQIQEAYQAALAGNAATLGAAQIKNQYQTLNPTQQLVNTFNGGVYTNKYQT